MLIKKPAIATLSFANDVFQAALLLQKIDGGLPSEAVGVGGE